MYIRSPHVFLLGILFQHRAFLAKPLNDNPGALADLNIHDGEFELLLPLKKELKDMPVFRKTEQTVTGLRMSQERITLSMISAWVRRIGELLSFEYSTICYSLQYMAGNKMDRSGTYMQPPLANQYMIELC